jgi:hypothetical protein
MEKYFFDGTEMLTHDQFLHVKGFGLDEIAMDLQLLANHAMQLSHTQVPRMWKSAICSPLSQRHTLGLFSDSSIQIHMLRFDGLVNWHEMYQVYWTLVRITLAGMTGDSEHWGMDSLN